MHTAAAGTGEVERVQRFIAVIVIEEEPTIERDPAARYSTALDMAHGRAGGRARVGYLLSPPYFPIRVAG